ncbi:sigma-70 family RNA polymerase sigma factor [Planctomycetales bacterium ZRK34]|nr:sigma-70 family RNA polymerase sigma factor [Planctomycetales bacterium ZRK34]
MTGDPTTRQFVRTLTAHQSRLYAFILAMVGDHHAAGDVLQETNVVLWEKADEAMAADDFGAWAYRVAHFQVLAWRQKRSRDRLVFDERVLAALAEDGIEIAEQSDRRQDALSQCLSKLPEDARRLIQRRYGLGESVAQIADQVQRSIAATNQWLYRIRRDLLRCIETRISREDQA